MEPSFYDSSYYERGLQTGKSCYQNYIWMPEFTIPLAMTIIDYLGIKKTDTILDYGSSKGFLVKAFRMLHRKAWGVDISDYALSHVPEDVKDFCHKVGNLDDMYFDFCVAKDVFEHIPKTDLVDILRKLKTSNLFVIVPLGQNGCYNAESNNLDKSHVICEPCDWWLKLFDNSGWNVIEHTFKIEGIKESYNSIPEAHGFFTLTRKQ
jgi:hypothetical protein